jgi:SAM-dependent methyltransferase
MPPGAAHDDWTWYEPPVVGKSRLTLPFPDASFDLVFSSAFGRLAQSSTQRDGLAKELARVLRPGGAALLAIGNRWCPIDMQDRAAFVHGPWHPEKAGLRELEKHLLSAGFKGVERLSLKGHFGWARVPKLLRPVVLMISATLAWTSHPRRRWIYASPLNTMFMLWISR